MENSKYEICLEALSKELLKTPLGEKALTITEFCDGTDFSRGTVQAAYMTIRDSESIKVNPRGRLGTFVEKKNYEKLFKCANIHYIHVGTCFPLSMDHIGINMGIKKNLEETLNVPVLFTQSKSSIQRLKDVLEDNIDMAVVSKYLALQAIINNHPIKIIQEMKTSNEPVSKGSSVEGSSFELDEGVVNDETRSIYTENFESNITPLMDIALEDEMSNIKEFFNIDHIDTNNPQHQQMVIIARESNDHMLQVLNEIMAIERINEVRTQVFNNQVLELMY